MIGVLSVFASRIRHYGNINKVMASTYLAMLCLISAASRVTYVQFLKKLNTISLLEIPAIWQN